MERARICPIRRRPARGAAAPAATGEQRQRRQQQAQAGVDGDEQFVGGALLPRGEEAQQQRHAQHGQAVEEQRQRRRHCVPAAGAAVAFDAPLDGVAETARRNDEQPQLDEDEGDGAAQRHPHPHVVEAVHRFVGHVRHAHANPCSRNKSLTVEKSCFRSSTGGASTESGRGLQEAPVDWHFKLLETKLV